MKKLFILSLAFLGLFLNSLFLNAESRVALVIGNSNYEGKFLLNNPKNDATDIARELKKLGFEVILLYDGDRDKMINEINNFQEKIENCDIALFFYSGHAMQVNDKNYLIPLGKNFSEEKINSLKVNNYKNHLEDQAVSMDTILERMAKPKNKILILDACRNNPFSMLARSMGSNSKGLAVMKVPKNTAIIYATLAGEIAEDGTGRNSPFTESLLKHISKPVSLGDLFADVNVDVENKTDGRQEPRSEFGGSAAKIYLAGKPETTPPVITNNTTKVETPTNVTSNTTKIEIPTVEYEGNDLTPKEQNGKYGFVDKKTSKVVIPFKYDGAWFFIEGLAFVKLNNKWGFIDKTGREVIPIKYDSAWFFIEGLASVKLNNKWGFIDKTDKVVIPFKYDNAYSFDSGKAEVELNGRKFQIDKNGNEVK